MITQTQTPNPDSSTAAAIIEYLSSEITNHTEYLSTFRSRIAFSVLVGPFLILGSFAVANHERTFEINFDWKCAVAALIACACYIGLGFYGAELDGHVTEQCDKWRKAIAKAAGGSQITECDLIFEHCPRSAYIYGIFLTLIAFAAITYLFFTGISFSSGSIA
jgi:hypothetical protein